MKNLEKVEALRISLHDWDVGVLTHYAGGKNILIFHPEFVAMPERERPIVTLRQKFDTQYLQRSQIKTEKIPPLLSNLLPEGMLREWLATQLKCHINHEFALLAYLGLNLPGALQASPIGAGRVPNWALSERLSTEPWSIDVQYAGYQFSLAGVQMKFSSTEVDGRYMVNQEISSEVWIIKTPSTLHKGVTVNEYSCMRLAEVAGIDVPEIRLVPLHQVDGLPNIQLPDEPWAYAIKRFDRSPQGRVHTEDFAQILGLYPIDKYQKVNYEQLAQVLYQATKLSEAQQLAKRLLVNVLLGNGDAHLKNWSIIYPDGINPSLAPLYDVVFTAPYIKNDGLALNLDGHKNWYALSWQNFQNWSKKAGLPWIAIKPHLESTLALAQAYWPQLLETLPMLDTHKQALRQHWQTLHSDFRIHS